MQLTVELNELILCFVAIDVRLINDESELLKAANLESDHVDELSAYFSFL
jgi:hypothetical protein